MKLYHAAASPYARKARITLREVEILELVEEIEVAPWTDPEGYRDITPLGKVPALEIDDGPNLFQSVVICEYFASKNSQINLYPIEGGLRWTNLRQVAAADGILDALVGVRVEKLFHESEMQSKKFIQRQELTVEKSLDLLEENALELEVPINAGQIALASSLGYIDFRFSENNWRLNRPSLTNWFETFCQRDSMKDTVPD
jgi:glutathione S-transferase|tara:strand:- start:86 stop:688 length:603 start_codon:yes stop_codon:yes gene_type:complete